MVHFYHDLTGLYILFDWFCIICYIIIIRLYIVYLFTNFIQSGVDVGVAIIGNLIIITLCVG